ncbi:peptidoglycan-associated lipoprotein Pal [Geobacter pelophilus]|uniref:Peptidoglycan-associated lipoprotein n=1 Tax=Geoanaerobacter pelophilus TaxID=60036 RepID=A0AAW4L2R7_9BACT|nr:peptidoglycan-associated lipoprotein Pal [Geoanaerobacter pelophilus]MBT0665024.1 peptidoglycan-associated lipoprotein Pal [Geoanaerobacter pelophilus]
MRKVICKLSLVIFCGALMMSGCTKEQVVKDEALAPAAAEQKAKQAEATKKPVKEETVVSPAIKESPVAKDEAAAAATAAKDQSNGLSTVYFDFDSAILTPSTRDTLSSNAAILLKKQTGVKVQIEGHCDERGSAEYNLALGERRAKSAMNYLVTMGVPASRLSTISYGKEKPVDQGHDEAAWSKNRRAGFVVTK